MLQPVAGQLERYMDLLSARQKLVASNIANADTPGYHTQDIDFQSEFLNATGGPPHATDVAGLPVKNDGNNVSLDREVAPAGRERAALPGGVQLDAVADSGCALGHRGGEELMSLFSALSVGASGMAAQRTRAELLVENLANAETTRTPEGGPYRRKDVVFEIHHGQFAIRFGFQCPAGRPWAASPSPSVVTDTSDPERRYMPGHPDADADGYVAFPKVNPAEDMVDLMGAARSYEANVAAIRR